MRFALRRPRAVLSLIGLCTLLALAGWCSASALAAAPTIEAESFDEAGPHGAALKATIDPAGLPTSYVFEYGPSAGDYEASTPVTEIGAAASGVGVIAHIEGLEPETTYHFRVVATNESGTTRGGDEALTTFPPTSLGLPDGRGYEMVTPVENENAEVYKPGGSGGGASEEANDSGFPAVAAADGQAVAYVASPTAGGNGSQGDGAGNQYLATRNPAGGWTQRDIQPTGYGSPVYWAFSSDLSIGVLVSSEPLAAGVPAEYPVLYTRQSGEAGEASYSPFFTVTPPNRKPREFYATAPEGYSRALGEYYAGASSDFSHLLFEADDALVPPAVDGGRFEDDLYESVAGQLRLVNVLPSGASEPNATFGAPVENEGTGAVNFSHVISSDGSRVFWTDLNTGALYVREDGATTSLIAERATYLTAAADGSQVLYIKAGDLYEDDLENGVTTDLAPGGEVQGLLGASEDLGYIYIVADADLAPGASAGKPNLYLLHGATVKFIATLGTASEEDLGEFYGNGDYYPWAPDIGFRTAEVTPDGRNAVFMSSRSLTGYDNISETSGEREQEVYVYDAESGQLSCASCDPSGERPAGVETPAGFLPVSQHFTYQQQVISEDGARVFFGSSEPLVPQASDGKLNVYEWERDGSGECRRGGGCIYLLSGGASPHDSYLLDASASGNDVFMVTAAHLLPQDQNEYYDVYDARVGVTAPPTPPQCTGTGCQGNPSAPPTFATPASVTFEGIGNFPPPAPVVKKTVKSKRKTRHKASQKKQRRKSRHRRTGHAKRAAKSVTATRSRSGVRTEGRDAGPRRIEGEGNGR